MPRVLTGLQGELARARGARVLDDLPAEPLDGLQQLAKSIGAIATQMSSMSAEQQAAVMALAKQHTAALEMLAKVLAPKPKALEEWEMTVVDRDEMTGKIRRVRMKQSR